MVSGPIRPMNIVSMMITLPMASRCAVAPSDSPTVPIAESIIVGEVPDSFVDVNNEEDMLNLIP